jgi:hypothetical protein
MKKQFTIGGAALGFLCAVGIMVAAYMKVPGVPGLFELLLQALIVCIFVLGGAAGGLLLGIVASLLVRKK